MKKLWIWAALMLCIVVLCGVYAFGYLYPMMGLIPSEKESTSPLEVNGHFVDVIVQKYNDDEEMPKAYYRLCEENRWNSVEPFESDPVQILTVDHSCFDSYIENSKVLNRLEYMALIDENGEYAEITPVLEQIFQEAAKLEHSILEMYILQTEEEYYVVVELNVNWQWPCTLYYFDEDAGQLVELVTTQGRRYLGLRTWVE